MSKSERVDEIEHTVEVEVAATKIVNEIVDEDVRLAACYLGQGWSMALDQWQFQCLESTTEPCNPFSQLNKRTVYYLYLLFHNSKYFRVGLLLAWCGLAFIEYPSWCFSEYTSCFLATINGNLTSPVPHFDLDLRPPSTTLWIELSFLLSLLIFQFFLKLSFMRSRDAVPWDWLFGALLLVATVDTIVSLCVDRSWRISPWVRIFCLLCVSATSRASLRSTLSTTPYFCLILLLLGFILFIFAWASILLIRGPGSALYFTDYITAVSSLQILMTTANFPDVMVPAYTYLSTWILIFFLFFILCTFYFLIPLLLGVSFNLYSASIGLEGDRLTAASGRYFQRAYRLLVPEEGAELSPVILRELIRRLRWMIDVPPIPTVDFLMKNLDQDGNQSISEQEFVALFHKIHGNDKLLRPKPISNMCWPGLSRTRPFLLLERFVDSVVSDFFVALLAVAQLSLIVACTALQRNDADFLDAIRVANLVFSSVFLAETLLRLCVKGVRVYLCFVINRVDLVLSSLLFFASLVDLIPSFLWNDGSLVRAATLLRIITLFRLLSHVSFIKVGLVALSLSLRLLFFRTFILFFCLFYLYSLIGMQAFGGIIFPGNPLLAGTAFESAGYVFTSHWNDMSASMSTLFQLLVVNNWFLIANGPESATQESGARVFFVVWWVISVLLWLNLYIGLLINVFVEIFTSHSTMAPVLFHFSSFGKKSSQDHNPANASGHLNLYSYFGSSDILSSNNPDRDQIS